MLPDVAPADLEAAIAQLMAGEIAVVPTDTVYGLAAALDSPSGIDLLYTTKGRPRSQPCQVLIYSADALDEVLAGCATAVADAVAALLPGTVTCLVSDPQERFAAASGDSPGSVGLRAPRVGPVLASTGITLVATSANDPGGADPSRASQVPVELREAAAVVLDAGELPGVASSVIDLRPVERGEPARLIRPGPNAAEVRERLEALSLQVNE